MRCRKWRVIKRKNKSIRGVGVVDTTVVSGATVVEGGLVEGSCSVREAYISASSSIIVFVTSARDQRSGWSWIYIPWQYSAKSDSNHSSPEHAPKGGVSSFSLVQRYGMQCILPAEDPSSSSSSDSGM